MPTEMIAIALGRRACGRIAIAWAAGAASPDDVKVHVRPHRVVGEPRHGGTTCGWSPPPPREDPYLSRGLAALLLGHEHHQNPPEIRYHIGAPEEGTATNAERGIMRMGQRICVIGGGGRGHQRRGPC